MTGKFKVSIAVLGALAASTASAVDDIPPDAQRVISAVHAAAAKHDFDALEPLMVKEFQWGFGPGEEGQASQAIEAWRKDPDSMVQLARVTGLRCGLMEDGYIECPANSGMSFRAIFTQTAQGWRMAYFLAGD